MGIFSTIFGSKPKAGKNESGNKAYDYLKGAYGGMVGGGSDAFNYTNDLLNVGEEGGFQNYLDSTGYNFVKDEAMDGLTNAFAGRGMLRSGPAGKAFQDRAANLGKTYFDNYLGHLEKQSGLGLGAGGLIGNAGQWSKGTGATQGSGGLLGAFASVAPFIFSDPRLKTDIEPVGAVGVYDYRYGDDPPGTRRRGFMADEVEAVHPNAMGPSVAGFKTIDPLKLVGG